MEIVIDKSYLLKPLIVDVTTASNGKLRDILTLVGHMYLYGRLKGKYSYHKVLDEAIEESEKRKTRE
jgi:hypothetical protein